MLAVSLLLSTLTLSTLTLSTLLLSTLTAAAPPPIPCDSCRRDRTRTLIHNGSPYNPKEYPYIVSLLVYEGKVRNRFDGCTGTLLSPIFVLTAAHCINGRNLTNADVALNFMDPLGKTPKRKIAESYIHMDFNPKNFLADIAMLKIASPFDGVTLFARIKGVPAEFASEQPKNCTVIGFGEHDENHTNSLSAHITQIQVLSGPTRDLCGRATVFHEKYWAHYLCSTWNPEGKAICKGDSGGPIFCDPDDKHAQYGVCSNMYNFVKHPFLCGDPVHRSKHVFLYLYQGWIDSFIHPPKRPEPSSDESDDSDYSYYSDDDSDEDEDGDYELEDDERTADKNGGTRGDPFGRGRTGPFRESASVLLTLLWATS